MRPDPPLGRAAQIDLLDLFAICQGVSLPTLLDQAPEKHPRRCDFKARVARHSPHFDGSDQVAPVLLLPPLDGETIKNYSLPGSGDRQTMTGIINHSSDGLHFPQLSRRHPAG